MSAKAIIHNNKERLFGLLFVAGFALVPLVALLAPRFLAYWPGIVGLAALAAYPLVFAGKPFLPKAALSWIAGILCLAGLSSLWSIDGGYALERTLKIALILLSGATLLAVARSVPLHTVKPYLGLCVAGAFAGALLCAGEIFSGFPLQRLLHGVEDLKGINQANLNRSIIATLCFLFGAIGIGSYLFGRRAVFVLLAAAILMMTATQSQSAQVGFVLATLCFFAFPFSRKKVWYALAALLAAGVLVSPFVATWMFESFAASVEDMPFLGRGDGFGSERLEIWDKISRYALQKPFYGYGIEATRLITDFDTQRIYRESVTELHPHNFAIQLWIEFGVIGALAGAGFLAWLVRVLSGVSFAQARIALPTFMVLLSAAAFGYGLWQSWFLGLIMMIASLAALAMRLYDEAPEEAYHP